MLSELYRGAADGALSGLVDLYGITMSDVYVQAGMAERRAAFLKYFRRNPFGGGYAITAGLGVALEWMKSFRYGDDLVDFLRAVPGRDGKPILSEQTLKYLSGRKLSLDVEAIPEGTVVFPFQPIVRVQGPVVECQLIEGALLNMLNFESLIATKAARICDAAEGDRVLEGGLRRAQGIDGSISATRAAFIGGINATSNVLAAKLLGIPVGGTHAHSFVMSFDSELKAFETYAQHMPNNCVFLVDTIDTIDGVKHAIQVGLTLRQRGYEMIGVRLDSGDLAKLSQIARKMLDEAGFPNAAVVASNDLDEVLIADLKRVQDAKINTWLVGTNLVTGGEQSAFGGVYKIVAIMNPDGTWHYAVKRAENPVKNSIPGFLNVERYINAEGMMIGDQIFDEEKPEQSSLLIDVANPANMVRIREEIATRERLLVPVMRKGEVVYESPSLTEIQKYRAAQMARLPKGTRRFSNPDLYPCGLGPELSDRRQSMLREAFIAA